MPDTMVDNETIKDAVILACCAPSLQNSEPWRWVLEGDCLELFVDTHRVVRRTDRGAVISGGEVLDHLRAALAAAGWKANVKRFPNPNDLLHLASIDIEPMDVAPRISDNRS
jgi:hypothetical protein